MHVRTYLMKAVFENSNEPHIQEVCTSLLNVLQGKSHKVHYCDARVTS
jgi:hypothetical protein